jgi:(p)ppGpp synthase/HD superfamily hydrolase
MALVPHFVAQSEMMSDSWELAKDAYGGQVRKVTGELLANHGARVGGRVWLCGGTEAQAAAGLLHDAVEDTSATIEQIEARVGAEVAEIVGAMTEDKSLPYATRKHQHQERLRRDGARSVMVFAADVLDNMEDMRACMWAEGLAIADRFNAPFATKMECFADEYGVISEEIQGHPLQAQVKDAYDSLRALIVLCSDRATA